MRSLLTMTLMCLISVLVAVGAVFGLQAWQGRQAKSTPSQTPAMDYIETIRCGRGINKIVLIGGVEDRFALSGAEPARINPAYSDNPYYQAIRTETSGMATLRDYDEGGQDGLFLEHFSVPRGLVSGKLIIVQRAAGDRRYDRVKFGDLQNPRRFDPLDPYMGLPALNFAFTQALPSPDVNDPKSGLLVLDLAVAAFVNTEERQSGSAPNGNVIDYLNTADRPDVLDLEIFDDTIVDMTALVLCQLPPIAKGTSFYEFSIKPAGPNVSRLSCQEDRSQKPCNPFQGDHLCSQALPLACYKPTNQPPPMNVKVVGLKGDEIKPSKPIVGNQLPTLASANARCEAEFGKDWRVLAYHDGSGGAIATMSQIAPRTRLWIDVRDQQYANCWDRDLPRVKQ